MRKTARYILFAFLLFLIIALRIFHIDRIPLGMHIDEAGLGLNAWSIANFGTDRYGNPMPVCPSNFYGEQSAFYTYFCAFLVKLFGLNLYTIRMPAAIMGILAVLFGSLLIKEKWGTRGFFTGLAMLGAFPCFIMNSRFALDCNSMLGALAAALYFLVRLLKKAQKEPTRKLYGLFALTGFLFGLVLYTYIIATIVVAVFCVGFGLFYLLYQKDYRPRRFQQLFCFALPLCLMSLPLIVVILVNHFGMDPIVTPFFSIPRMIADRTQEVTFSFTMLPRKLRSLACTLTSDGKFGSSDQYFTMYPWSIPFVFTGGLYSLRETVKDLRRHAVSLDFLMLLLAFAQGFMFLLCGQYNYHINGIFTALAYFCASGILCTLGLIRAGFPRIAAAAALTCLYGFSFLCFTADYFRVDTSAFQLYGGVDSALALLPDEVAEREIYIMDEVGEFYFLSHPLPPAEFSSVCNDLGYITDYKNMHFYQPDFYSADEVYVCNKSSGRHLSISDTNVTGIAYTVLETDYYYVFYSQ